MLSPAEGEAHLYGFEGRQQLSRQQRSCDGQRSVQESGLIRHIRRSALVQPRLPGHLEGQPQAQHSGETAAPTPKSLLRAFSALT